MTPSEGDDNQRPGKSETHAFVSRGITKYDTLKGDSEGHGRATTGKVANETPKGF